MLLQTELMFNLSYWQRFRLPIKQFSLGLSSFIGVCSYWCWLSCKFFFLFFRLMSSSIKDERVVVWLPCICIPYSSFFFCLFNCFLVVFLFVLRFISSYTMCLNGYTLSKKKAHFFISARNPNTIWKLQASQPFLQFSAVKTHPFPYMFAMSLLNTIWEHCCITAA